MMLGLTDTDCRVADLERRIALAKSPRRHAATPLAARTGEISRARTVASAVVRSFGALPVLRLRGRALAHQP